MYRHNTIHLRDAGFCHIKRIPECVVRILLANMQLCCNVYFVNSLTELMHT